MSYQIKFKESTSGGGGAERVDDRSACTILLHHTYQYCTGVFPLQEKGTVSQIIIKCAFGQKHYNTL